MPTINILALLGEEEMLEKTLQLALPWTMGAQFRLRVYAQVTTILFNLCILKSKLLAFINFRLGISIPGIDKLTTTNYLLEKNLGFVRCAFKNIGFPSIVSCLSKTLAAAASMISSLTRLYASFTYF